MWALLLPSVVWIVQGGRLCCGVLPTAIGVSRAFCMCWTKDDVFPTTYPLKLSKVILNLTLMLLLKWNWSSFIVVLCPWLNCYGSSLCSLDLLRYAHPPKSISQVCACLLYFLKVSFPECQYQIIKRLFWQKLGEAVTGRGTSFTVKSWKVYLQTVVLLQAGQEECSALPASVTNE